MKQWPNLLCFSLSFSPTVRQTEEAWASSVFLPRYQDWKGTLEGPSVRMEEVIFEQRGRRPPIYDFLFQVEPILLGTQKRRTRLWNNNMSLHCPNTLKLPHISRVYHVRTWDGIINYEVFAISFLFDCRLIPFQNTQKVNNLWRVLVLSDRDFYPHD